MKQKKFVRQTKIHLLFREQLYIHKIHCLQLRLLKSQIFVFSKISHLFHFDQPITYFQFTSHHFFKKNPRPGVISRMPAGSLPSALNAHRVQNRPYSFEVLAGSEITQSVAGEAAVVPVIVAAEEFLVHCCPLHSLLRV